MDRRRLLRRDATIRAATPEARRAEVAELLDQIVWAACQLGTKGAALVRTLVADLFESLPPDERPAVDTDIESRVEQAIERALERQWWPNDIASFIGIELDGRHRALVAERALAVARRNLDLGAAPLPWRRSFDDLDATTPAPRPGGVRAPRLDRWLALLTIAGRLHLVPPLPSTLPPPGRWVDVAPSGPAVLAADAVAATARQAGLDAKLLERVRALLAKAEGTEFEEEAEAFTAKAQELMTRHGIEAALLAGDGTGSAPSECRIWIENPYADVKALLINQIADVNRCRVVGLEKLNVRTIVGFDADLVAVEVLFTSLLVQGATALQAAGKQAGPDGRTRTTSFRRAFWMSFAVRIGARLRDAVARTVSEADVEAGGVLLPVLASRQEQVEATFTEAFPTVARKTMTASNAAGWAAGHHAADRADLSAATARLAR